MTETRLLDVNVLVALAQHSHVHHAAAQAWLAQISDAGTWATCPITEVGCVRILTNPRVTGMEHRPADVLELIAAIRAVPGHRFLSDMTSLSNSRLDLRALVGTKQVTDFHLVNLAAASNAVLATFDRRLVDSVAHQDRQFVELIPV